MNNLIPISNAEHLTALVKSIVPRSFEKTFGGLATLEIVAGFRFCTQGLDQAELNTGLDKVRQMGYCPDPALFAKWCKGIDGFDNGDVVADSYIGKHGALANIKKWLDNPKNPISQAEKWAYDESYQLWQSIHSENDRIQAELAFKDFYVQKVAELVKNRVMCQTYTTPVAIGETKPKQATPTAKEYLEYAEQGLANLQALLKAKQGQEMAA